MRSNSSVPVSPPSHRQVVGSRGPLSTGHVRDKIFRLFRVCGTTVLLVAWALSAPGCSDHKRITPPAPEDPRKTIPGVMLELVNAYAARDIDRYTKLFDTADFMFVFDSLDVLENPDIPPNWDWQRERRSAENMFEDDSLLERIQVDFIPQTPVSVTKNDVGERPFPEETMKVVLSEVALNIDMRDPAGGENIVYRIQGDEATFFLYPDRSELVDDVPVWKIFEWRDKRPNDRGLAVELKSWGGLKWLFR